MKDIAAALGVSIATVSRALKNSSKISAATRKAIKKYAREHNFIPNIIAESLRSSKRNSLKIIGVIVPQITHFYFSTILSGIEDEASRRGYMVMVAQSDEMYEREAKICEAFLENKVCGVIVSQAKDTVDYNHFHNLVNKGIPLVFYDRICTGLNASRVVVDDYKGSYNAVVHMIQTGCRRIAFYGTTMRLEISKNRFNGYKTALLEHGIPLDEDIIKYCDNRIDAEVLTPQLLSMDNPPDAFFAVNDDTAIGILYSAKRQGLRVPEDVSVCGFTNGDKAIACDPMLTTVEQRGKKVGMEAADILIRHVEGELEVDAVEKRIVKTRLVVRGTTRPLNDNEE